MPKILERSHSVEPNSSSPPKDPNPLRYLRQQSLPVPKYTATIEATIVLPSSESEVSGLTGHSSPSKTVVSKAVPMLTPKPYSQPKNTPQVLKTFKVDGKVSMNGETCNGVEEEKEKECTTLIFAPSPSRTPKSEVVAEMDASFIESKQVTASTELSLRRTNTPSSAKRELTTSCMEEVKQDEIDPGIPEMVNLVCSSPDHKPLETAVTCASPTVNSVEVPLSNHSKETASKDKDLTKPDTEKQNEAEVLVIQKVVKSESSEQDDVILPFLKKVPEISQVTLQNSVPQGKQKKINVALSCTDFNC
uniref:Uncharacterized protein n=1 Tax=Sphenodon punctatus TaxID=8508 RepID=A0A8D0GAI7_SPHPU